MFKRIFQRSIHNITSAAILVAIFSLASRVLGLLRDRILAGKFGAGSALDTYYAAFRIPDLIFNLVVLGALSAGFIPIFSQLIRKSKVFSGDREKEAWDFVSNVVNSLLVLLLALSLVGIIFAPILTNLIAPGFDLSQKLETTKLTRIMFLSPVFLGLSGILGGVLQSFKKFLVYSLAPIFYNLGIIIGALYFVNWWGIVGLAWGVVLGAVLHFLCQLPSVWQLGFRYKLLLSWTDKSLRKLARMMVPRTMSLAIAQINLVVITVVASQLSEGSLSAFNFANNLQAFPVGIFGISFAIAAFPALSEQADNYKELSKSFSHTIRQILFFVFFFTVILFALRAQIVRVVYGTGSFDWRSTVMTMDTLGYFSLSLIAQACIPLLTRVFYARGNSKTPFYYGFITIIINIFLSLILGKLMGVAGLALAFSIANIVNLVLLWVHLYVKVGSLDLVNILRSSAKFTLAALATGLSIQIAKSLIWPFINMMKFSGVFIQLLVASLTGLGIYSLFCYLLDSSEYLAFVHSFKMKLSPKKIVTEDQGQARL